MEGLFALLAFAVLFFLMMRFGCGSHISHGGCGQHHGKHAEHGGHGAASDSGIYTCPMHPEVRQPSPGTCPKCGMTLEPASKREGE